VASGDARHAVGGGQRGQRQRGWRLGGTRFTSVSPEKWWLNKQRDRERERENNH